MKIAFNPSTVAALTSPPDNKDITFDLRGRNIFARGVKFYGTDTNTWRDIKINNVSIGSNILDLRNGSNTTLTNINGVVTINSTWRPVVDNLTSNSATSSLSANQGRVLAGLINGKSDSDHNHDGRYIRKSGDTMLGALNFANGTWNLVGDDSYMGDCNISGHFGIKAANTTYPGIAFFNNASAFLGNLTAYSGNIKYGAYSLQFLDNGNTSVSSSTWTNPFSAYNSNAVADGQAICVWGQASQLSNLSTDTGDMSLWLKRVNAHAATLNMVLDGEYYANGNQRLAHVSEIPTSLKNPYALTISLNGTSQGPYDGSAAKNINITPGSIGAAVSNHSHDYLVVNTADDKSFNSAYHNFQVLYAGGSNGITGKPANVDAFGLFRFRAAMGWSGQMLLANGGSLYIRSSEDAKMTNTLAWKTILDSSNYSGILDSRYYTESEVNNLLSNKLNISNFNWTNLPGKIVAGNKFNIVNAGFKGDLWFNYLPINDRSKSATISAYCFGNGNKGYTAVRASGFIKNGGNENQLLRADGGVAAFNWSGQAGQPTWLWGGNDFNSYYVYNPSNFRVTYASSAGNAETLGGFPKNYGQAPFNTIPCIGNDGVMEIGRYIDYHYDNSGKYDFSTRLQTTGNYGNMVNLPSASGTLALISDNVASATNAYHLRINSANTWSTWYWAGQSGQPSWLWGSNDGINMYVWNPNNFNVNTAQYLRSLGNQNCQIGRTQAYGDVYTYNTYNNTGSPTAYTSVIGFGRGIRGTVEIAGGWCDTNLYWRSLRDCCEDWYSWRTVLDSDNYTDFINNYYWANVKISTSANTQTQPSVNTIYASNWFISQGTSGWYSESYGGGIWMNDSSWIRTYGGKSFYCDNQIYSSNSIRMSNILLEHTDEINNNANGGIHLNYRNSGNVSLCQGGGKVGIGTTTPAYKLDVKGQVKASGFIHSDHSINDAVLLAGGGYERIFMLGTTRYYNNTSYELSFHKLSGLCNNLVWVDGCIWNSTSISFQLSSDFYPYLYANSPSMRTIYRMDGNNMITVDGNGIVIISCSSYPRRVGFFYTGRA